MGISAYGTGTEFLKKFEKNREKTVKNREKHTITILFRYCLDTVFIKINRKTYYYMKAEIITEQAVGSVEPVNEGRYYYFRLDDSERDALKWEMEIACGNMGKTREQIKYRPFMSTLTEDELKKFRTVVDYVLDDYENYRYVNSRMLTQELPIIKRFLEWMDERDMFGENWDLMGAYDKICGNRT